MLKFKRNYLGALSIDIQPTGHSFLKLCNYSIIWTNHRATKCHLPYAITQCYLPLHTGERALP